MEQYLTIREVEKIMKVSRSTLHRWRKKRKLKAKKIGGSIRYKLSDIQKAMK